MKIKVYQIPCERDPRMLKFFNYAWAQKHGGVKAEEYKCVFDGEVDAKNLEGVYTVLNLRKKPFNYHGHSLSVSDVVETQEGYYFCDSFGFVKRDNFNHERISYAK